MKIPIQVLKDSQPYEEFDNLQECFRHFRSRVPLEMSDGDIYDFINFGIDDDLPWNGYEFKMLDEVKEARKNRRTRKVYHAK